jgi:hypothetical protein
MIDLTRRQAVCSLGGEPMNTFRARSLRPIQCLALAVRRFDRQPTARACLLLACALLAGLPGVLHGQVASVIQGYVSDTTGGAIAGAAIKATNQDTGVTKTAESTADGYYRIPDLLPGPYEVRAEISGFKTFIQTNLVLTGHTVTGVNISLEVGDVTESVTVAASEVEVETQEVRISGVIDERELRSLPLQGRGVTQLALLAPGITGRAGGSGVYCCDVFSNFSGAEISSGGNERKEQYFLDGITLRYSEGSSWSTAFSPNPDAVAEVRVSTDPHSAELGRISGPQVQIVSKGGTNEWHGTGHYTFQDDTMNAKPYFSGELPDSYYRLYGGTIGGPIIRDRLFVFGAFEGLRAKVAGSFTALTETEQFKNQVTQLRPDSIAAAMMAEHPPLRYPTEELTDLGALLPGGGYTDQPDGTPDVGLVRVDSPFERWGTQINTRVDYHFPNGKDRIYASYWRTRPKWGSNVLRPDYALNTYTATNWGNFVHTRTFSPTVLNEARFALSDIFFDQTYPALDEIINKPGIFTDDGISWNSPFENIYHSRVYQVADNLSLSHGRHAFKIGVDYRHSLLTADWPNAPSYYFANVFEFATDTPYEESRTIDSTTGATDPRTHMPMYTGDFSIFMQNSWQVLPNLTVNYGLRWETFFPIWIQDRPNAQPVLTSDEVTNPAAIAGVVNRPVDKLYNQDFNNFGPRIGIAWDPTSSGRMVVRAGFGLLYDEVATFPLYDTYNNPPGLAFLAAGPQYGSQVTYGLAPQGTRQFPINPELEAPELNDKGGIAGARTRVSGIVTDLESPMILSFKTGVQYQAMSDVLVQVNYSYRSTTNDLYNITSVNRFQGDLVDGLINGFAPDFAGIRMLTNRGERRYHGFATNLTKRFSQGYMLTASYTYNYGKNNDNDSNPYPNYYAEETDPLHPEFDYARDDTAHVFTLSGVWELPILRNSTNLAGKILGGWVLNSVWNFQSGGLFRPFSGSAYGNGGDFNADGVRNDRPDAPVGDLPSSFSKGDWQDGALEASAFPLPDAASPRPGTLARDRFRGPGYANIDLSLLKEFRFGAGSFEDDRLQVRFETFNLFNRVNITGTERNIANSNFGRATGAAQNRVLQLGVKYIF